MFTPHLLSGILKQILQPILFAYVLTLLPFTAWFVTVCSIIISAHQLIVVYRSTLHSHALLCLMLELSFTIDVLRMHCNNYLAHAFCIFVFRLQSLEKNSTPTNMWYVFQFNKVNIFFNSNTSLFISSYHQSYSLLYFLASKACEDLISLQLLEF